MESSIVDPAARPTRRTYPAEYRARVLAEYEAAPHGQKSAVLRREGIYQTLVAEWATATGGAGEKSSWSAYLATEARLTSNSRAISLPVTPWESSFLTLSCTDMGTVICFLALPAHALRNGSAVRNITEVVAGSCP